MKQALLRAKERRQQQRAQQEESDVDDNDNDGDNEGSHMEVDSYAHKVHIKMNILIS